ncbi:MAG TPA: 30S ribosomal protein S18, partial [Candidatus Paceibacterota bacterium]|nr:30S ribosomal protein S18 [Candidatus Paceibacterota bacterium]
MKRSIQFGDSLVRVDYKDVAFLRKFVTSEFKLKPAKRNKLSDKDQRRVANAIKIARYMALMPYTRNQ